MGADEASVISPEILIQVCIVVLQMDNPYDWSYFVVQEKHMSVNFYFNLREWTCLHIIYVGDKWLS